MAAPGVRLFISCVSGEFAAYRDALRQELTRPNVEVKIQEDFKPLGGDTLHMLEAYIERCEAVVHFVGDMAGSTPASVCVDDLLARRPDLKEALERKGLTPDALGKLTYTQWEAWLAIGLDKDLLIVAPVPGMERGPSYASWDASRKSQAEHLQRLKAIDRYPIKFTNADNLVASILKSAVIDALVMAQAAPRGAKKHEPFGAMIAAIVAGLFVLFIDKMLPLDRWFGGLPIFIRVVTAVAFGLFAWLTWRYWDLLGGAAERQGSRERADYAALFVEIELGGAPAKVYREWLTTALDRLDVFFGDTQRNDKSWLARALGLETPGARWTAPAFDRCLLLALLYPVVTILLVWMWSGHVGVAERAIGLGTTLADDRLGGLRRLAVGLSFSALLYALRHASSPGEPLSTRLRFGFAAVALAVAFAVAAAGAFADAFARAGENIRDSGDFGILGVAGVVAVATAGGVAGAVAGAVLEGMFAGVVVFAFAFSFPLAFAVSFAAGFALVVAAAGAGVVAAAGVVAIAFALPFAIALVDARFDRRRTVDVPVADPGCSAGCGALAVAGVGAATIALAFNLPGGAPASVGVGVVGAVALFFGIAGVVSSALSSAVALAVNVARALNAAGVAIGAVTGAVAYVVVVGVVGAFGGAFAGTSVGIFFGVFLFAVAGAFAFAFAFGIAAAVAAALSYAVAASRLGRFLSLFFVLNLIAAFTSAWLLSSEGSWHEIGIMILLFGLLTLVNAPFDWFAIGLTRALLRRGLAPGGQGPYFYATIDAIVAVPVIALLAFVTVFAVQTFDDIAVLRVGPDARILPLDALFTGLETRPSDPEFWWVWLMLFSTLIPSAVNLCIAAASFIRGSPFLSTWILTRMQTPGPIRDSDRLLLAGALSAQIAGGFLATGVALYLIGAWFLPIWLPILGGYLRDFSEVLEKVDVPTRIMMWLAGVR